MHKVSDVLSTATVNKNLKPTATGLTAYEQDVLFDMLKELTNHRFKAWYCQTFKKIGRQRVMELASIAKADGKNPPRYFSFLLRKEII